VLERCFWIDDNFEYFAFECSAIGVVPFLIGDAIKSILAMGLAFKLK